MLRMSGIIQVGDNMVSNHDTAGATDNTPCDGGQDNENTSPHVIITDSGHKNMSEWVMFSQDDGYTAPSTDTVTIHQAQSNGQTAPAANRATFDQLQCEGYSVTPNTRVVLHEVQGPAKDGLPVVVYPGPYNTKENPPPPPAPAQTKEAPHELVGFVGAGNRCLIVLIIVSVVEITAGAAGIMLGDHTATFYRMYTKAPCPTLWWTGIFAMTVGVLHMIVVLRKSPKEISLLYKVLLPAVCIHTLVMVFAGVFYADRFSAWPYAREYHDRPVCKYMVDRCYCQDYFHGAVSLQEVPGVQYIHSDIKWKDTLFVNCDNVEIVSRYYYGTMFAYGLFLAAFLPTAIWGIIAGTNSIRPYCVEKCLGYESPMVSYKKLKAVKLSQPT